MLHIQLPSLRVIGNVVSGNAKQTQKVIELGGLEYLKRCLFHEKKSIRKETCWIISNLAAGTSSQVEALIRSDYLPTLQKILNSDDLEVIYKSLIKLIIDQKRVSVGNLQSDIDRK